MTKTPTFLVLKASQQEKEDLVYKQDYGFGAPFVLPTRTDVGRERQH